MHARLIRREVLPFLVALGGLAAAALAIDALMHVFQIVWIGRYLGIPGTMLIVGSFAYSLRRRRLIVRGQPAQLLRVHEGMAWTGSLLVLVHAGIHFNSILGWLAVCAMVVNVGSGLTGKYLLDRSRKRLDEAHRRMREHGVSPAEIEERMYWDSFTFDAVRRWRAVHFPITMAFVVLSLAHIVAVTLFWGWK
jgi:hypothetical protein